MKRMAWLGALALFSAPALGAPWDAAPWLADLAQMRTAFHEKYGNLEWLEQDRGVALDPLLDRTATRLRVAGSDAAARAVLDRLMRRIDDGHVELEWPTPPDGGAAAPPPPLCARLGFDATQGGAGIAFPGAVPLGGDSPFPAAILTAAGRHVGVLRIGVFQPDGSPKLCEQAAAALGKSPTDACDDACEQAIRDRATAALTVAFADRLRALKTAGATVLMIDLTGNGGGTEWAEAAARMVTAKTLASEPLGFVRGAHWETHWRELAADLRNAAAAARPADRKRLLGWATEADAARAQAACTAGPSCARTARAGFATGLVGAAPAGAFAGVPWAAQVFSPSQYRYADGIWSGPLIVLVDGETWSAAEEFAAVLQDNHAAIVLGNRTGGAGCGHTDGGTPTILAHSGATLELPDCIRYRADGSNEVNGVVPDVPVAIRWDDGDARRAGLVLARLPEAIAGAEARARRQPRELAR